MSFLSDYRLFASGNEAHPTYHVFSGLATLAALCGPRTWLDLGYFKVSPNLYVILVGPPGNKKTTAKDICEDVLRSIDGVPLGGEKTTKEKLTNEIAEHQMVLDGLSEENSFAKLYSPMMLLPTEFSHFVGVDPMGMLDLLTTVYDRRFRIYDNKTKNAGSDKITGPCISLLSCTTPDWITFFLKGDIISGGFSRRVIFVYETEDGAPVAIPKISVEQKLALERCIVYGRSLKGVGGPMRWDPDALEFYEAWYNNHKSNLPNDAAIRGYHSSKHIQALKVAMLLSLSESRDLMLMREHFEGALRILGLSEINLSRVFDGIGRNELSAIAGKVIDLLHRAPDHKFSDRSVPNCLLEKELKGSLFRYGDTRELDQVIQHLIDVGKVKRLTSTSTTGIARNFLCLQLKENSGS